MCVRMLLCIITQNCVEAVCVVASFARWKKEDGGHRVEDGKLLPCISRRQNDRAAENTERAEVGLLMASAISAPSAAQALCNLFRPALSAAAPASSRCLPAVCAAPSPGRPAA